MDTITLDDLMVAPVQTPLPAARKPKVDFTPNPEKKRGRGRRGHGVAVFESAVAPRAADQWHGADRAKSRRSKNRRAVKLRERHTGVTRVDPRRHESEDRALERQAHNARVAAEAARRYQGRPANWLDDTDSKRPSRAPRTNPHAADPRSRLERAVAKFRRTAALPPVVTAPPQRGGVYVLRAEMAQLQELRPQSVNQAQYARFLRALLVRAGVEENPGPSWTSGSFILGFAACNAYAIALYLSLLPDSGVGTQTAMMELTASCIVLSYFVGRHALCVAVTAVALRFTWFYLHYLLAATRLLACLASRWVYPVASSAIVKMADGAHPDAFTVLRAYDSVLQLLAFYAILGGAIFFVLKLRSSGAFRFIALAAAFPAVAYYTYLHGLLVLDLHLAASFSIVHAAGYVTPASVLFHAAFLSAVTISYIKRAWLTALVFVTIFCAYHISYRWLLLLAGIEPNPGPHKKVGGHRRKLEVRAPVPVAPIPGCTQRAAEELAGMGLTPEATCICCHTRVGCRRGTSHFCFDCHHELRYHVRSGGDMPGPASMEQPLPALEAPPLPSAPPLPEEDESGEEALPIPVASRPLSVVRPSARSPSPPVPEQGFTGPALKIVQLCHPGTAPAVAPPAPPSNSPATPAPLATAALPIPVASRPLSVVRPSARSPGTAPAVAPPAPPPKPPATPAPLATAAQAPDIEHANALSREACRGEALDPREFVPPDRDPNGLPSVGIKFPTTGLTVIEPTGPVLDGIHLTDRQVRSTFFALGGVDWLEPLRALGFVPPPVQVQRRVAADAAFGRERRLVVDRGVKYTHADLYLVDCRLQVATPLGSALLKAALAGLACTAAHVVVVTLRVALPFLVSPGLAAVLRLLVLGFPTTVAMVAIVRKSPRCMRTATLTYCPHMLSCCVREFGHSATSESIRANVNTKLLRLATIQLPDVEAAQCTRGTEAAAVFLLEDRDFFGLSAA